MDEVVVVVVLVGGLQPLLVNVHSPAVNSQRQSPSQELEGEVSGAGEGLLSSSLNSSNLPIRLLSYVSILMRE